MTGKCRFCGQEATTGIDFSGWVKPTFTDWDKLQPGEIVCMACLFFFEEASTELQTRLNKDKPQRMRNYSHFIVGGQWLPLSKSDKAEMRRRLLTEPFPELAAIAESGQKHIVFRALHNPSGGKAGWVQFEEQRVWVESAELAGLLGIIETLYTAFSKTEIETGAYAGYRILKFGLTSWLALEEQVKPWRGRPLFSLALFLAQRKEHNGEAALTQSERGTINVDLAGNSPRLQKPLPDDDLDTVRERDPQRGVYQQPGKVRQLALFETER